MIMTADYIHDEANYNCHEENPLRSELVWRVRRQWLLLNSFFFIANCFWNLMIQIQEPKNVGGS